MVVKLIIDTDGVADDVRAISLALQHPDCELLAITTVHGCISVGQATTNVLRTIKANEKKVPVYKGCEASLLNTSAPVDVSFYFGKDGNGDQPNVFPAAADTDVHSIEPESAAMALIRMSKKEIDITLVCLGALTNIAIAIKLDPAFSRNVSRMVIMGGNYYGVGNIRNSSAECNFHCDPEAAHIVLTEMKCALVMIPWELYFVEGPKFEKLHDFEAHLNYDTPLAGFLSTVTSKCREHRKRYGCQVMYCDEVAVAAAIDFERIATTSQKLHVEVELTGRKTRGQVMVDWMNFSKDEDECDDKRNGIPQNGTRLVTFVTSYDFNVLDNWMHSTTSGKWSMI